MKIKGLIISQEDDKLTIRRYEEFDCVKKRNIALKEHKTADFKTVCELAIKEFFSESPKFKVDDIVKIVDSGKNFSTYTDWFIENGYPGLKKKYKQAMVKSGEYIVRGVGKHSNQTDYPIPVYAIADLRGDIYLIGEDGLDLVNE